MQVPSNQPVHLVNPHVNRGIPVNTQVTMLGREFWIVCPSDNCHIRNNVGFSIPNQMACNHCHKVFLVVVGHHSPVGDRGVPPGPMQRSATRGTTVVANRELPGSGQNRNQDPFSGRRPGDRR